MNTQPKPDFLPYGNAVRVAAVLAVIALHISGIRVSHLPDIAGMDWMIANSIDSLCRWAVPVFVMLSGALLLDPARSSSWSDFYRKRSLRVGIPFIFWISFYFYWAIFFNKQSLSLSQIKSSLVDGMTQSHLYFLFIIIGLYAVTPFLRYCLKKVSAIYCLAAGALITYLAVNNVLGHSAVPALTRFVPYILYFLLGYALRRGLRLKYLSVYAGIAFLAASAVIIVRTAELVARFGRDDYRAFAYYDHFNATVIVQAISVFLIFQQSCTKAASSKLLSVTGQAAFGIYLIHAFVLEIFRGYVTSGLQAVPLPAVMSLEVFGVFAGSTALVLLLLRIPFAKMIVGS